MVIELSPIQAKILYELTLNSKIQNKVLAKKLGISRQLLTYHISRLGDEKLIRFVTSFFVQKLSYRLYNVLLQVNSNSGTINAIAEYGGTSPIPCIVDWSGVVFGSKDIMISLIVKSFEDVNSFVNDILKQFKDIDITYEIYEIPLVYKRYPAGYTILRSRKLKSRPHNYLPLSKLKEIVIKQVDLKDAEKHILNLLRENSRLSLREISKKTSKSIAFIASTIRKFERYNIIRHFSVVPDTLKLNLTRYKLFIKFKSFDKKLEHKFYSYVIDNNSIHYTDRLIGKYDASINFALGKAKDLHKELSNIKDNFGQDFDKYELLVLTDTKKLKKFSI